MLCCVPDGHPRMRRGLLPLAVLLVAAGCSSTHKAAPTPEAATRVPVVAQTAPSGSSIAGDPVLIAAGDIASCKATGDTATVAILDTLPGAIAVLGDNAYEAGTAAEYRNCYDPTWGARLVDTHPVPGNHEYETANANGYYGYFGAAAGDPAAGYYSYDLGAWHVIAINSNCMSIGGCGAGSPEEVWLRADLAAHRTECTLAYWHHPRYSSGTTHGDQAFVQPIWQALYDYHADVVLSGHEHNYERFALQDATGGADALGIREFVVGTGGRSHYAFGSTEPNSEVRNRDTFGVLVLTLHADSYDWRFVPEAGKSFSDAGSASCHGP